MTAREEALTLRAWAEANGFFTQGRATGIAAAAEELGAGQAFSVAAQSAFSKKPITAIGFADGPNGDRVFVYTKRKLTKGEIENLEKESPVKAELIFRSAVPFSISSPSSSPVNPLTLRDGRLTCGGSISVGNNREAGTLGALLRDKDGQLYGLSCNHVTGGCSNARVGIPIVAPGILDVGAMAPDLRVVGHHHQSMQFISGDPSLILNYRDNHDAAVFQVLDPEKHSSYQGAMFDTPGSVVDIEEDMVVEKVGRSTGHTQGIVESQLVGSQRIDYKATAFHSAEENSNFQGSVYFSPLYVIRGDTEFAAEGDSGALVVSRSSSGDRSAVGIVIGGDRTNNVTYMLPLKPILDKLSFDVVSNHN